MDNPAARIPADWRERWDRDGYIHIKNALSASDLTRALAGLDDAVSHWDEVRTQHLSYRNDQQHSIRVRNAAAASPPLLDLVDHPAVFPVLLELLGPDVHVLGTEAFVRHGSDEQLESWHTDGGASLMGIVLDPASRALQLKVQYFLTDVSEPDLGNFTVIPGSHRRVPKELGDDCFLPEANYYAERGEQPPDARQILAGPGDAVVFPYNLWHAVARNSAGRTRRSVIIRYGHLWHRPLDFHRMPPEVVAEMTERQRQLFGEFEQLPHPADYYKLVTK